jgi:hypothetical protein
MFYYSRVIMQLDYRTHSVCFLLLVMQQDGIVIKKTGLFQFIVLVSG